jgi:hypothetical protein
MRNALSGRLLPLLLVLSVTCTSCQTDPKGSDAFIGERAGWPTESFGRTLALYLPNRIIDLVDIVHVGAGFGPGFGVMLQATRPLRIGAGAGMQDGVGWFGRMGAPFSSGHYAVAAFGPYDAQETTDVVLRWRAPYWDFAVWAQFYLGEVYFGVAPDEIVDFIVGLTTYDMKDDDYGRDSGRETRQMRSGGVEDATPKPPDEPEV